MANASTIKKSGQWPIPSQQWWIYFFTAILILVLASADAGVVLNLREQALVAAEKSLQGNSRTLAEEADRAFQSVDLVLTNLIERLDSAGVVDADSYERAMSSYAVHLLLREKLSALPQLDAITMINREGKLINFSRYWPIPEVTVADRDYFQTLKADPARRFFLSKPVQNRGDGNWTIYLARRVNGSDGTFAGLVLGAMAMKYFEDFYQSVRPGESSAISMIRDDGVLLARYPPSRDIGKAFPDTGGQRALGSANHGTIREPSPIDGLLRIKAAARVTGYPLIILTTITQADALGNWSAIALTLSFITGGCALAIAFAAGAVGRWSKQQRVLAFAEHERSEAETARLAAESELLREREKIAAAANRAKSNFLAMMSHEIRTPMNAVLGLTDSLLDDTLDAAKRKIVETIRESGDTLLRILNDILDYSKMEAGRISFENLAFAPGSPGENMLSIMGSRAAAKGIALTGDFDPNLPPALLGDAGRIRQVLMNLVSNALKFTQHGGIAIKTRCLARDEKFATIEWIVSDSGIGIPSSKIGNLFDEFTQADGTITRRFGGTGLGLAISKRLIDQMGGTISVDSTEGSGTTFRFQLRLPLAAGVAETSDAPPADSDERLQAVLRAMGRPMRVLVAEDNPTNQFVLAQLLKDLDIRVSLANDGLEAVEAAASGTYDLIFMDMQMPEMDGLEATRVIRKRGGRLSALPIIALTANAFPEDVRACQDAGMDDFIAKPVRKGRLIGALVRALAASEGQAHPAPAPLKNSTMPVAPALDDRALAELADDLGIDTARGLVNIFASETRARLQRIIGSSFDPGLLLREIHTLTGAARTACAPELARLSADAEARLRRAGGSDLPEGAQLVEAFHRYESAVRKRDLLRMQMT